MKHKFKFDKATGTMVPDDAAIAQGIEAKVQQEVVEERVTDKTEKPVFTEEKSVETQPGAGNAYQNQVLQFQRTDTVTPVQLVDEDGIPESYLDAVNAGVVLFRERNDYDICQIVDENTNKPLAYIGGYALQIKFNMAELTSTERIDQCLNGLSKLFRKLIMDQALSRSSAKQ